jgi:hypothetical protein
MKKNLIVGVLFTILGAACQKSNQAENIVLTASSTSVVVGENVQLNVTTSANLVRWTFDPSLNVRKDYEVSTLKTNTVSFSQPGVYTISVRGRRLDLGSHVEDSMWHHHGADSVWHHHQEDSSHHGGDHHDGHGDHHGGGCHGNDSTDLKITVRLK